MKAASSRLVRVGVRVGVGVRVKARAGARVRVRTSVGEGGILAPGLVAQLLHGQRR